MQSKVEIGQTGSNSSLAIFSVKIENDAFIPKTSPDFIEFTLNPNITLLDQAKKILTKILKNFDGTNFTPQTTMLMIEIICLEIVYQRKFNMDSHVDYSSIKTTEHLIMAERQFKDHYELRPLVCGHDHRPIPVLEAETI